MFNCLSFHKPDPGHRIVIGNAIAKLSTGNRLQIAERHDPDSYRDADRSQPLPEGSNTNSKPPKNCRVRKPHPQIFQYRTAIYGRASEFF